MHISEKEKRVLQSLYLQGTMGNCGSMPLNERRKLLKGLVEKGLIDGGGVLTRKGIEAAMSYPHI